MSGSLSTNISSKPGFKRFHYDYVYAPELKRYGPIHLYQLGDLSCDSGFALHPHKQSCYEISYVVSGAGWFSVNGKRYEMQAGDLFLCRPGDIHEGGVDGRDPFRYYYFGFRFDEAAGADDPLLPIRRAMDEHAGPMRCRDRLDVTVPFVHALKELNGEAQYSHSMTGMYLEQLLVLTYRNYFSDWQADYPGEHRERSAQRAVYSAVAYIDDRLLSIKDLKEVSDALGYSLSHLSHLFVKVTGDSLRGYYAKRKWHKTVGLLEEGGRTITEIASMMQYESIHTFSRAFKKAMGVPPSEYVRSCERPQYK
ncbi:AraC family transcriptional regulator [Paenibacillus sp. GYB004]|uniref:AraC family transcriptional regulator n=1 Tax=Paenibacillus sp. GYB004 TaxID=2994393 RepID=UPI002F96836A